MVTVRKKPSPKQTKRTNNRWGSDLIRLAMKLSSTSSSMVYAVLKGRAVSAPVSRAIEDARADLRNQRRRVA